MRETIPAALAGERVDRVVSLITGRSRAEAADLVAARAVMVDGKPATSGSQKLREGQVIDVDPGAVVAPAVIEPDADIVVPVVLEDGSFLIVDKPAGLVVHPGSGHAQGTMVNGLMARYPELAAVGDPARPGIVHRLDAGTSGLLVVARTQPAYDALVAQLAARTVHRVYLALVLGHVAAGSGVVDAPIGRSSRDRTRMAVANAGRPARTAYEVTNRFREPMELSDLVCRLETGRTHQIRVHLKAIGHPVAGDARYGGDRGVLGLHRPYLHAHNLAFEHPITGALVEATSELPADLEAMRGRLA